MDLHPRIIDVAAEAPYNVCLTFRDGSTGTVDLEPWFIGWTGVFAPLKDPAYFARVFVDVEAGTIAWPNGVDLDPDMLYDAAHGIAPDPSSFRDAP